MRKVLGVYKEIRIHSLAALEMDSSNSLDVFS